VTKNDSAQRLGAHDGGVDEIGTKGVGAEAIDHGLGGRVVLLRLRHLLGDDLELGAIAGVEGLAGPLLDELVRDVFLAAVVLLVVALREHETVDDDVLERALAEQRRAEDDEGVEPAAGLVEALGDEARGEGALEGLLVLEGVVHLRVGHRAGLEPAVEDVGDALVRLAVLHERQVIDLVGVDVVDAGAGQRAELVGGAQAEDIAVVAAPDRDGRAPEARARDGPVARLLQPVVEAGLADEVRDPMHIGVGGHHALAQGLDLDVPGGRRLVDERRAAPPAVRVGVLEGDVLEDAAPGLEVLDDVLVGILDVAPGVGGDRGLEVAFVVDGVDELDAGGLAGVEVVLAVGGRHVDETGTVRRRDVAGVDDAEGARGLAVGEERKQRRVAQADEGAAGLLFMDDMALAEHLGGEVLRDPVGVAVVVFGAGADVLDVVVYGDTEVRRQRPRGRRPDEQALLVVAVDGQTHREGGVVDVAVVEAGLEVRQRRRQAPRIGHDAQALVDEALVEELLEGPPHALHEREVHGLVVVVEVDPATDAGDGLLPLVHVAEHAGAALLVELPDAVGADVGGAREPELLLDVHLDGQTVGVPAEATLDAVTAHRPVARDDVLQCAGDDVAVVRQARREGRAVVEDVGLLGGALVHGAGEDVAALPELEDAELFRGKGGVGVEGRKDRHGPRVARCVDGSKGQGTLTCGPPTRRVTS
jgi:hypothetical protein